MPFTYRPVVTSPRSDLTYASIRLQQEYYPPANFDATLRTKKWQRTAQFEYCLTEDGKIWARYSGMGLAKKMIAGNLVDDFDARSWHLFDGIGVPCKGTKSLLLPQEYIIEIEVAAEVVVAVTNLNRIYMYRHMTQGRKSLTYSTIWSRFIGQPLPAKMYLPSDRLDWCFSLSVGDPVGFKGIKRNINAIHPADVVWHYTDGNGVKHAFGNTSTVYVLFSQKIVYWDTGLAGFARGCRTPENGTISGQSLSAAGSTIFLCGQDNQGRLRYFTRMIDYEINGSCPGLKFTYTEQNTYPVTSNQIVPLGLGLRKLPLEGWREHVIPVIPGVPQDSLSCKITIQMAGSGNSGRQLFIGGWHPGFGNGYYTKNIDAQGWLFYQNYTPVMRGPIHQTLLPLSPLVYDYQESKSNLPFPVHIQLLGFHTAQTAEEPSFIRVSYQGQSTLIRLHTVDGWRLLQHNYYQANITGSDVEPELLNGTIVLSQQQLTDRSTALGQIIQKYFLPYHSRTNQFIIQADDSLVIIKSADGKLKLEFSRNRTQKEIDSDFYIDKALSAYIFNQPESVVELENTLLLAETTLRFIRDTYTQHRRDVLRYSLVATGAIAAGAEIVRVLLKVFPSKDPRRIVAIEDVRPLLRNQLKMALSLRDKPESYKRAVQVLEGRITQLKAMSSQFDSESVQRQRLCYS